MGREMNIRKKFRQNMFWVAIIMMITTALLMATEVKKIAENVSKEYARLYANELVCDLESHISREIGLIVKTSKTSSIIEWMKKEPEDAYKKVAYEELMQFNDVFNNKNVFVAVDQSKKIYFLSEKTTYPEFIPSGKLDKSIEEDIWYFKTLQSKEPYNLNVDVDRFLNTMRVWINVKVLDKGEVLGVVGTGLYLDPILKDIFSKHNNKGAKSVIINEFGVIQMDADLANIKQNSFGPETSESQTIYVFSTSEDFKSKIKEYLEKPKDSLIIELKQKDFQYAAIKPIQNTRWYAVTFFNTNSLYEQTNFFPIILIVLGATLLLVFLTSAEIRRIFVIPFERLKESLLIKEYPEEQVIFGLDRTDEFGELAKAIQQMRDSLVKSVPVGLFIIDDQMNFLYGNPYFLKQFSCESVRAFREGLGDNPKALFVNEREGEQLLSCLDGKTESASYELELQDFSGRHFWADIRITKVIKDNSYQYEGILMNAQGKKDYEEQLVTMAIIDQLTGLYNRHHFEQVIEEEMSRSDRYDSPLSMIIFDLDHFKLVNDKWGHDAGDLVLAETARKAKETLRISDIVVRWGGEEFAILMPGTDLHGATRGAEKVRVELERISHGEVGVVTASFGVAQRMKNEAYQDWFKRADQALFKAKENGRNLVVKSDTEVFSSSSFMELYWNEKLNSGNPVIDEQHMEMFRLANRLMIEAFKTDNYLSEVERFNELKQHVILHLKTEPEILKELGYPKEELQNHIEIHEKLAKSMTDLGTLLNNQTIRGTEVFMAFINEVVLEHLLKEDVKFFPYTKE